MRTRRVTRRLLPRRAWPAAVLTAGLVLNGLRHRQRLSALRVLPPVPPAPSPLDDDYVVITAAGVTVDATTRAAAAAHARAEGLDVVDLIPADLPTGQLLELARLVDTTTYRTNPLAAGRGARHALLADRDVAARAGLLTDDGAPVTGLDPAAFLRATAALKRYAPRTSDLVVAPGLTARDEDLRTRRTYLRALYAQAMPLFVGTPLVEHAALAVSGVLCPPWGAAALAAYAVQPTIVTGGTPLTPRDHGPVGALTRAPRDLLAGIRTLTARADTTGAPTGTATGTAGDARARVEARRPHYQELLAGGTDRFFEPRRATCPRCRASDLRELLRVGDLLQYKPGTFVLDECARCGHVFQNPRLTVEGLDFYYGDFYDGLGEEELEFVFTYSDASYRGRAEMVRDHVGPTGPKRWLDVGGGHGHFCLVAAGIWPETRFDGLDLADSIRQAEHRGWIEHGYHGLFPDLAPELAGAYDVVSMHHYLEHTREPWAELEAAHGVLEPGGHLLIEVPDPESRFGRWFGRYWGPWFQPQHQHFLSVGNLTDDLDTRGFSVVAVERGPAHQPVDLAFSLWMLANDLAPRSDKPWREPPTGAARAARIATFASFGPALILALAADHALAPAIRQMPGGSNTYRVLACRH